MLKQKELFNLRHEGRNCIGFSYQVVDKDRAPTDSERNCFVADWTKGPEPGQWNMRVILDHTRDADSQVYNFGYIMPRENMDICFVAATGLKYFQLYLKQEIQRKSNFDFVLGELLKDM